MLLVPGFFSPKWMMLPLRGALRRQGFSVRAWDGASVFGPVEKSVAALARRLQDYPPPLGVVTHSFGDWLCRQALQSAGAHPIRSMVSIVPLMASSPPARAAAPLGRLIPEIGVMADPQRSASGLALPAEIDRLVIWARIDPWVRRPANVPGAREVTVAGTHNTVVAQQRVYKLVTRHFRRAIRTPTAS